MTLTLHGRDTNLMKKKLVITGGTGFMGSLLINSIHKKFEIIYVGRNDLKTSNGFIQFSIENIPTRYLNGAISVLHLATYYSKNSDATEKIYDGNINFGKKLLTKFDKNNIELFLYTNTMFAFQESNKNHYYTQSKIHFSNILYEILGENKISEIFLDNTFHYSDKRKKAVPSIIEALNYNQDNPINNHDEYINLTYAPDVISTLLSEVEKPSFSKSRVTSSIDIKLSSIYSFLSYAKKYKKIDKSLLTTIPASYLSRSQLPMVNSFYIESDVYSNLYNLIAPDLQK